MAKRESSDTIGLVAGNGQLAVECAKNITSQNIPLCVSLLQGEASPQIETLADNFVWCKLGEVKKTIRFFQKNRVKRVIFLGGVSKVRLFGGVRFDWVGLKVIRRAKSFHDDALLRSLATEFESRGFEVISAVEFLPHACPERGVFTKRIPDSEEVHDAMIGWNAAKEIGRLDIGQGVVVHHGVVIAVEAIEGTDATILRSGELMRAGSEEPRGVLVKVSKPSQDLRLDLPSFGLRTVQNLIDSGIRLVVLEEGKTLIDSPLEVLRQMNDANISLVIARSEHDLKDLLR